MSPARRPRERDAIRLMAIDPSSERFVDMRLGDLPRLLRRGDLLVVNDAATLPASLPLRVRDASCELRLARALDDGTWQAVLMGAGDWRTPTEHRPPPPLVSEGERVSIGWLDARIVAVSPLSPRLVTIAFDIAGASLWQALYALGRPIQYSHLLAPLELWSVQTSYAGRPWAVEAPSAGLPLGWELLGELRALGIALARLTHAAGLSATGDPAIDAALPFPERYDIPDATARAIADADRVIAVGTTVVRALEGCAHDHGRVTAGAGTTDLRIRPGFSARVVDGLLTGMHQPSESHYALLGAFVPAPLLSAAFRHALGGGYLGHEFGDATLVLDGVAPAAVRRARPAGRRPSGSARSARRSRLRAHASSDAQGG